MNTIFTAFIDGTQSMLSTLLLAALLIFWLQLKFNKEFSGLRKEVAEVDTAWREETAKLRDGIGDVSDRLARIKGKLNMPARAPKRQSPT